MNKEGGFIKVYRSLLQWEWHDDPITVATWFYCLLRANWGPERWHGEIIQAGQFVTSLNNMAKDIGITKGQLRTALKHLNLTRNITQSVAQHATLITVENWCDYQSAGEKVAQSVAQETTSRQHLDDISIAPIEEYKEYKEYKEPKEINRERVCHSDFSSIKATLMSEAAQTIAEREADNEQRRANRQTDA